MGESPRRWKKRWEAWARALRARLSRPRGLAGTVLVAGLAVMPVQAQEVAPAHWVAYARQAGTTLQARLSEDAGELVTRLHAHLAQRADHPVPGPVMVQVWISGQGREERSAFDSLGSTQADADLRALLASRPLPPPPADMRQPLVLRLRLQPNPDFVPAPAATQEP